MDNSTRVVILCEDRQHSCFARYFLEELFGLNSRKIIREELPPLRGGGSAEQFVRESLSGEIVEIYRRRHENVALIVVTDADAMSSKKRRESLLNTLSPQLRSFAEEGPVGIFTPKRNVETWLEYLQTGSADEGEVYPHLDHESSSRPLVQQLAAGPGPAKEPHHR